MCVVMIAFPRQVHVAKYGKIIERTKHFLISRKVTLDSIDIQFLRTS